jgi:hypothetical protein
MSVVPALQRSFQQQPLAQFDALQSAEPLLLELLLAELLAPLLAELLPAAPLELLLELLLALPLPDEEDEDVAELLELPLSEPPAPPEAFPLPPPEMVSKSSPVAQATKARDKMENTWDFFIWAPWGPRRC